MSDETESRLVDEARAGDARALAALIERHQARVYRFGMKMCRDPEDAKEVLQDTLLELARGIRGFRGGAALSTWLYTVARSRCIKRRRKGGAAPGAEVPLDDDAAVEASVAAPPQGPDEALAGKEMERAIEDALAALAPAYREVLVLRDVEGLSAAEVAEVTGASVDAVKSRLHRARLAVRARLAPLLELPAPLPASTPALAPTPALASTPAPAPVCPDVLTLFSRHLEGEIGPDVCAEMERHLAGCDRCRGACDTLRRTLLLCRTLPAGDVPPAVQRSVKVALQDFLGEG